ncbi:MAG: N-acetyl sugar amidotransferase [Bacteroidales bacterium]|nr:N-acetyl sugar amidotransferase [Bacteroidales bacterium]
MDTNDSRIHFDEHGVCDQCNEYKTQIEPYLDWSKKKIEFESLVNKIKEDGRKHDFDCLLGMSGGVDSSYMLHFAVKKLGLRPLVFHVDGGWNSEIAVNNIQMMVDKLGLDLYTEVINWEEMKDFQLALFKSGVPYLDAAQDLAFVGGVYKFAEKYKIKYILNGYNYSSEFCSYPVKYYCYTDSRLIDDIREQFCTNPMKTYPMTSVFYRKFWMKYIKGIKFVQLLTYFPYSKNEAKEMLQREYGWMPYPQKHFESRFTRFFESFWLPERFGYDPRSVQFSSLILAGQMTRTEALEELRKKPYNPDTIKDDFKYVATKLGITVEELQGFFDMPQKFYWDYKNNQTMLSKLSELANKLHLNRAQVR